MGQPEPVTETMNLTHVREHWSPVIDAVARGRTRVVLEKDGIPVAALVSAADLERLRRYDAQRAERFTVIDDLRAAFADIPDEELEREISRALTAVRARRRAAHEQAAPTP